MFERSQIERRLAEAFPASRPFPSEVAHYTALSTLLYFLPESETGGWTSLRATNVRYLNDRQEFALGCQELTEAASRGRSRVGVRAALDGFTSGTATPDVYSISFSGNPDEIGQWRGYADNGMGASLTTAVAELHRWADVAGPVIYEPAKRRTFANKIIGLLRGIDDTTLIAQYLQVAAALMKHEGFAPEREYRMLVFGGDRPIVFRPSGQRIVSSVEVLGSGRSLQLTRVLIGPGWQLGSLNPEDLVRHHVPLGLRQLLNARQLGETDLAPSVVPYDPR